jgi:hypothetical protein
MLRYTTGEPSLGICQSSDQAMYWTIEIQFPVGAEIIQVRVKITLRPTVSQFVLVSRPIWGS